MAGWWLLCNADVPSPWLDVNIPSFSGQLVSLIGSSGIVECLKNNHIRSVQGPFLDSSQSERSQNPLCSWPAVSKTFSSFPFNLHPMLLDRIPAAKILAGNSTPWGAIRQHLSKLPPAFMLPTISIRFCWETHRLSVHSPPVKVVHHPLRLSSSSRLYVFPSGDIPTVFF